MLSPSPLWMRKSLTAFSSFSTPTVLSHMPTKSKTKSCTRLTKKQYPNIGMRSGHFSIEKHPSPMVNKNGMVFSSYLKKNCQLSPDSYKLAISHNCGKGPCCNTLTPHVFHIYLCINPHIMSQHPHDGATHICFHEENAQNSSPTVPFFYLTTKPTCHIIWKPPMHGTQTFSALSHCSHFWSLHSL